MNREVAAAYLAAMIDGEGHVGLHVYPQNEGTPRSRIHRVCTIANTDTDIIERIEECCHVLGITFWKSKYQPKGYQLQWCIHITNRDGFEKLTHIPIAASRKRQALHDILRSYRESPRKSEIESLYAEGLTLKEVGLRLGMSASGVHWWMKKYGLERRLSPVPRAA